MTTKRLTKEIIEIIILAVIVSIVANLYWLIFWINKKIDNISGEVHIIRANIEQWEQE